MSFTLLLYILFMLAGIWVGANKMAKEKEYVWIGRIQFWALMILLAALGVQIGSNEQVIASLSTLGLSAFLITALSIAGSAVCMFFVRKWLKFDREGVRTDD